MTEQDNLNRTADELNAVIHQLQNGLITLQEFTEYVGQIRTFKDDLAGLLCPFTGLRFPA